MKKTFQSQAPTSGDGAANRYRGISAPTMDRMLLDAVVSRAVGRNSCNEPLLRMIAQPTDSDDAFLFLAAGRP